MKKILIFICVLSLLFSFAISKQKTSKPNYTVAFVEEVYLYKGTTDGNDSLIEKGEKESIERFIGIFPKKNDTITIYKLKPDTDDIPAKNTYWVKKSNKINSIIFCSATPEWGVRDIKVTFKGNNTILIDSDVYIVNDVYYQYLKQNILLNKSILDLAFFLKNGYSDCSLFLEPLNKNWRNQKEINPHRIIKAKIKNQNGQKEDTFFSYELHYKYNKNGTLQRISGDGFNKEYIGEDKEYVHYVVDESADARVHINKDLYINKRTLFDSVTRTLKNFSRATTEYDTKYQSTLRTGVLNSKPKNIQEIMHFLKI